MCGSKAYLSHLQVFGCKVYALIPDKDKPKLNSKAELYCMLRYCESTKGYRLADLQRREKVTIARNVEFVEHEMAMFNVRKKIQVLRKKNLLVNLV
jgi:hypothetical protein